MSPSLELKYLVEAALFAAEEPLTAAKLIELVAEDALQPSVQNIKDVLAALQQDYRDRGIELKRTASGWRFQTRQEFSLRLKKLWAERPSKYSRTLLETLAIIAYRQPITRAEIEAIRGVAVNPTIIKTLLERAWIKVIGHREVPGKPELLGTSKTFLDYFNLRRLSDLPTLPARENSDLATSAVQMHLQLAPQHDKTPKQQT